MKKIIITLPFLVALAILGFFFVDIYAKRVESTIKTLVENQISQANLKDVKVAVSGRDVTLSGDLTDRSKATKAEQTTKSVLGVRNVNNRINILEMKSMNLDLNGKITIEGDQEAKEIDNSIIIPEEPNVDEIKAQMASIKEEVIDVEAMAVKAIDPNAVKPEVKKISFENLPKNFEEDIDKLKLEEEAELAKLEQARVEEESKLAREKLALEAIEKANSERSEKEIMEKEITISEQQTEKDSSIPEPTIARVEPIIIKETPKAEEPAPLVKTAKVTYKQPIKKEPVKNLKSVNPNQNIASKKPKYKGESSVNICANKVNNLTASMPIQFVPGTPYIEYVGGNTVSKVAQVLKNCPRAKVIVESFGFDDIAKMRGETVVKLLRDIEQIPQKVSTKLVNEAPISGSIKIRVISR